MRILHLSDLHLTGQFKSFEDVWSGPSPHLKRGSFDFVVVSGDLSQRAGTEEYRLLGEFLERSVLPLLVEEQRARLVLVPGNHDVDWGADIGDRLSLGHEFERDQGFAERLQRARLEPEHADLRVAISRHGHLNVLRIDPARYPLRFQNVQRFLEYFYRSVPASGHFRPFQLTHPDDAQHWSAHVFPSQGLAFYGFSSCHQNDRLWTGAMLSAKAVEQARLHAEQHAQNCIRLAVWHHGLDSGRGRPDHLSAQDLALLYNAGFRIGMHGHTHQAAYETFDSLFSNRFFVVSTGSLGAGAEERPDAVGNQFSIVQVYPGHVDVEIFSRNGASNTYERNQQRRRFLLRSASTPRLDQLSHAERHQRTWTVDPQGTARVMVDLQGVTLRSELTLALVEPPFCNVLGEKTAQTSTGQLAVERTDLPDGRIRFTLVPGNTEVHLESLSWSYRISNCLALTRAEMDIRGAPNPSQQHLPPGLDGRPHTVRFPCDEFTLTIRFQQEDAIQPNRVHAVALTRTEERGLERWVADPAEKQRLMTENSTNHVQLTLHSPLVDYRYLVAYEPSRSGAQHASQVVGLLEWLLEQCRDRLPTPESMHTVLTQAVDKELERVLGAPVGRQSEWVGYLWHPKRHHLMAAFGMVPNRGWSVRFSWGAGIAGHALRFSRATSWTRGDASPASLLYRPGTTAAPESDYTWIVCIPLLTSLDGSSPAVGVIGFAGNARGSRAEEQLREYAGDAARQSLESLAPSQEIKNFQNQLFSAVNSAFWQVLLSWSELTPSRSKLVREIAEALQLPAPHSLAPTARPQL